MIKKVKYEQMKNIVLDLIKKEKEFTAYDIAKKIMPERNTPKNVWNNNYYLITRILNDLEKEKVINGKYISIENRHIGKKIYKKV